MIKKAVLLVSVMILSIGVAFATSIPSAEKVEIVTYASVTGSVVDANSGEAIPNATVTLNETSVTTDKYGSFAIEEINPGNYTITVEAEGYEKTEKSLEVTEEGANVEITLQSSM